MNVKWPYEDLDDVVQSCVKATHEYMQEDCVEGFVAMS